MRTDLVSVRFVLSALLLALPSGVCAQGVDPAGVSVEEDEDEADSLQERLTEREDKRRPLTPRTIDVFGRPLTVGGEFELALEYRRDRDATVAALDRATLAGELEIEAFYSFGPWLSLFAQGRLGGQDDLFDAGVEMRDRSGVESGSGHYFERGEMWLYSEDIAGSGIDLDLGRLHFEDDRRWWWDEELDAVRAAREFGDLEVVLAAADERGPDRSGLDWVDPEHDRVRRYIAEASLDWRPNHALQLFALRHDDRSRVEVPGQRVRSLSEDDSDARLTWLGARLIGGFELGRGGVLGYWLDWAQVQGSERLVEYEAVDARSSEVVDVETQAVRGRAYDVGVNWLLPFAVEPRLFAGFASGTGDGDPDDGIDHGFRQTGLQANEAGFGGVERFARYGYLLDPELSNLRIATVGAGLSLWRSSSLDVVFHDYRLQRPAEELRDARVELALEGTRRDLGQGLDLVLAVEEWERYEFGFIASVFQAGRAVSAGQRGRHYGALLVFRIAF